MGSCLGAGLLLLIVASCGVVAAAQSTNRTSTLWTTFLHNTTTDLILRNKAAFTHISVLAYMVDDNGLFACSCDESLAFQRPCNNNGSFECPWWDPHMRYVQQQGMLLQPTITLPPGYKGAGLRLLLQSTQLQERFISSAVKHAAQWNFTGYNIDWENPVVSTDVLAAFLGKFRASLHQVGKTVSFDTFSSNWIPAQVAPVVDVMVDMSTYGAVGQYLIDTVRANMAVSGGSDHYGLGFLPPSLTPVEMTNNFAVLGSLSVVNIYTWPNIDPALLPQLYWDLCSAFLQQA